ncbi:MAG: 6-pyruvoyl trahydropterin synthase family protein [Brevinematia bacterium]
MTYKVVVRSSFRATHKTMMPNGEWEQIHGHDYSVEVCVSGKNLDKFGVLIDFVVLKNILDRILDNMRDSYLNENPFFRGKIPTAENVARFVFDEISKTVDLPVEYVKIDETDGFSAIVSK